MTELNWVLIISMLSSYIFGIFVGWILRGK